jgi:hypothetical protein
VYARLAGEHQVGKTVALRTDTTNGRCIATFASDW